MAQLRILDSLAAVDPAAWDALDASTNPFLRHAFLHGLEQQACLRPAWGWAPRHATLWDGGRLLAAAPAYRKDNSHGEFVFDHAWARAWPSGEAGYYPKWLVGVPYSPVVGPRLLARNPSDRRELALALQQECRRLGWSSVHVNFHTGEEAADFDEDWLARCDVQLHWRNFGGWRDFDGFLSALTQRKRKNLRSERERLRRAGVTFRHVHGDEAAEEELALMHGFYCATQHAYGNHPALGLGFFRHLARSLPRQLLLVLADRGGACIAGALFLRGPDCLYGRYWGCTEALPGLHFETCYHQGIEYCLRHGLDRFEPGAQGEHKLARGFLPVLTHSHHYLDEPGFRAAAADWCRRERAAVLRYREALSGHGPFRDAPPDPLAVA
jgi:hypothetical protein